MLFKTRLYDLGVRLFVLMVDVYVAANNAKMSQGWSYYGLMGNAPYQYYQSGPNGQVS